MTPVSGSPYVAVVGPAQADPGLCELATEVGRLLAEAGAVVVTGGLAGVMAAASRGAYEAGATTVGVLPGTDRSAANPWVTTAIATGLGQGRNQLIALTTDAMIAVGGSWGTWSEIAHANRLGRPVVVLHGWRVFDRAGSPVPGLVYADDPAAAVASALGGLRGSDPNHS